MRRDRIFSSVESSHNEKRLELLETPHGNMISVGNKGYHAAEFRFKPEEYADFAEAVLRSLDPETRASVMAVRY